MTINILELVKGFCFLVGLGVVLHYYAYAIAWGVAKGWAKVIHQYTQIWKTPDGK